MLSGWEKVIFFLVLLGSLGASRTTFGNMFRIISRGTQPIDWRRLWHGLPAGFLALLGRPLFKTRQFIAGVHTTVAWGFILYMLVNLVDLLDGLFPGFSFLEHHWLGNLYRLFVDVFSVLVLLGIIIFVLRRFVTRETALFIPAHVMVPEDTRRGIQRDSALVAAFIFFHVGFRFVGASFAIANGWSAGFQPAAGALAGLWAGLDPQQLQFWEHASWWLAIGLILAFIPYFPYTKHAHLFMGPLNHMVQPARRAPAALETIDFEDESIEQYGAALLEHLPQKEILDAYACIMCNRCQDACPATITGKPLSPSALEVNKRYFVNANAAALAAGEESGERMTSWMLTPEAVWACTSCAYCVEVCPVGNEPMVDILRIRQDLVMMESDFPQEAVNTFKNLENNGNPWGQAASDRERWTEGLEVPRMREKRQAEYLYWVGCAGAYDARGQKVSRAMVEILNRAGVDYAILGTEETCTGDTARRLGNEYLFAMLAEQNIETLKSYGVRKIITQCPHCFNTLLNDYPELGGEFTVLHHTQFLQELIREGKLQATRETASTMTYHDSCYLGRHNDVFQSPREILRSIPGVKLQEMPRSGAEGLCCGAGGGRMWQEETLGHKINEERMEDVAAIHPDEVVTACPFCATMINDGLQARELPARSRDIAEYLLDSLPV